MIRISGIHSRNFVFKICPIELACHSEYSVCFNFCEISLKLEEQNQGDYAVLKEILDGANYGSLFANGHRRTLSYRLVGRKKRALTSYKSVDMEI